MTQEQAGPSQTERPGARTVPVASSAPRSVEALAVTAFALEPEAEVAAEVAGPLATQSSLLETIAAPGREVHGERGPVSHTVNNSILPRIEQVGSTVRLVPSDGGERYRSVKTLGRGGMGEVALVEDQDIGRTVAVKRLLAPDQPPAEVARFIDEVRTVGALEHPNIVPIHDVGVDEDGRYFFVMKYVDGETLEDLIKRLRAGDPEAHAKYPPRRRLEIFISLLRALQYAHDRAIIHRDLKPANVMVGRFGEVVLMDWGIARPFGEGTERSHEAVAADDEAEDPAAARAAETQLGQLIGTPMYMSPEQAYGMNNVLDPRSDLFSACVLLHEFLGLRHRFEGSTELQPLLHQVRTAPPPSAVKVFDPHPAQLENIPYEMAHFLRRGWRIEPSERWQSAAEMIEELQAILDGRCRVQCATTLLKRSTSGLSRFVDRRPGTAIVVFYGAVVSLVVLGVLQALQVAR